LQGFHAFPHFIPIQDSILIFVETQKEGGHLFSAVGEGDSMKSVKDEQGELFELSGRKLLVLVSVSSVEHRPNYCLEFVNGHAGMYDPIAFYARNGLGQD